MIAGLQISICWWICFFIRLSLPFISNLKEHTQLTQFHSHLSQNTNFKYTRSVETWFRRHIFDIFTPLHYLIGLYWSAVLTVCNRRLFLLSQLKYQTFSLQALTIIFGWLILSKITNALPAFALTKTGLINYFARHFVSKVYYLDTDKFDQHIFKLIPYPDHCLHVLLPERRSTKRSWQLRTKGHDYTISHISTTAFKNAFVNRCLLSTI